MIVSTAAPPDPSDPAFIVDCDFEGVIALCHYTNSKSDDADWGRKSGALNDNAIGPVADHTYGNGRCLSSVRLVKVLKRDGDGRAWSLGAKSIPM